MQLHELKVKKKPHPQRIGRGGKRGSYSGRGVKGQKSRAGRRIRPALRDLIIRIPKKRGFRNKPKSEKPFILDIAVLGEKLSPLRGKDIIVVDREKLAQIGIISGFYKGDIKILGKGNITFPIFTKGMAASKSAKESIEKAGGKVEI